ncbi:hypothetical protein JCM24511_05948 [Saitozyma sp. JCM 24511]|nr:hypothetical protein JCM24511_05948 [Saitozyma sp. JCM 24511]
MMRAQHPMVWSSDGGFVLEVHTGMLTEQLATIFMETEPEDASSNDPGALLMMRLGSASLGELLSSLDTHRLLSGPTVDVPVHDTTYGPYQTHSGRYDLRSGSLQPFPSPEEEMHIMCTLPDTIVGRHPVSESCALKTGRNDPGDDEYKQRKGWIGLKTMIQNVEESVGANNPSPSHHAPSLMMHRLFYGSLLEDLLQDPGTKDTMGSMSHLLCLRESKGRAPHYELQGSTSWLTEPSVSDTKSRTYKHRLALTVSWPALSPRPRPFSQIMSVSKTFVDELCTENFSGRIYTGELDMSNGRADGVSSSTAYRLGDIKGCGKFKHPTSEDVQTPDTEEAVFYTLTVDTVVRD